MPTFASAVGDDVKVCVCVGGDYPTNLHGFPHCVRPVQREGKDR